MTSYESHSSAPPFHSVSCLDSGCPLSPQREAKGAPLSLDNVLIQGPSPPSPEASAASHTHPHRRSTPFLSSKYVLTPTGGLIQALAIEQKIKETAIVPEKLMFKWKKAKTKQINGTKAGGDKGDGGKEAWEDHREWVGGAGLCPL